MMGRVAGAVLVVGARVCVWRMSGGGPPTSINTAGGARGVSPHKMQLPSELLLVSTGPPLVAQRISYGVANIYFFL